MNSWPLRVTTRNGAAGRRTPSCFAGVGPSATFDTTTVKLRIRPFVVSHVTTAGCDVILRTSSRTIGALSSSGGPAIASGFAPSGRGGCGSGAAVFVAAGAGTGADARRYATYAAMAARTTTTTPAIHRPERGGRSPPVGRSL